MISEANRIQIMLSRYRAAGYTHADISYDVDEKIIRCGLEIAKLYLKNPPTFRLTNFVYLALRYSYTVLKNYGHVAAWDKANFVEAEAEWRQWKIVTDQPPRKSLLVQCVVALARLIDIQMNYTIFHLKQP